MLALLVTSVLISNALSPFLPPWGGFTVRQIHTLAAYWVLVIVAVHLGLRWPMLMGVARNLFGIRKPSALRTLVLRVIARAPSRFTASGVALVLGLGAKLSMQMTLDWWNFEESVAGFFVHCVAVAGLAMVLTYYGLKLVQFAMPAKGRRAREAPAASRPGYGSSEQGDSARPRFRHGPLVSPDSATHRSGPTAPAKNVGGSDNTGDSRGKVRTSPRAHARAALREYAAEHLILRHVGEAEPVQRRAQPHARGC